MPTSETSKCCTQGRSDEGKNGDGARGIGREKAAREGGKRHLGEVGDEAVLGGGAGDVEGEEGPEAVVGAAGPHELLPQGYRAVGVLSAAASSSLRSGRLRLVGGGGGGEGGAGFLSARRLAHRGS
jgi:hypothetical protein